MILGNGLIIFSLLATVTAMAAYLPGVRRSEGNPRLAVARPAVYALAAGLTASIALLWFYIITHQFQYSYVFPLFV